MFTTFLFSSLLKDVKIGLRNSSYNVEEGDRTISICADIIDGCLGRDVWVQYSTFDGSAEGTHHKKELGQNSIFNKQFTFF